MGNYSHDLLLDSFTQQVKGKSCDLSHGDRPRPHFPMADKGFIHSTESFSSVSSTNFPSCYPTLSSSTHPILQGCNLSHHVPFSALLCPKLSCPLPSYPIPPYVTLPYPFLSHRIRPNALSNLLSPVLSLSCPRPYHPNLFFTILYHPNHPGPRLLCLAFSSLSCCFTIHREKIWLLSRMLG